MKKEPPFRSTNIIKDFFFINVPVLPISCLADNSLDVISIDTDICETNMSLVS